MWLLLMNWFHNLYKGISVIRIKLVSYFWFTCNENSSVINLLLDIIKALSIELFFLYYAHFLIDIELVKNTCILDIVMYD